MDISIIGAGPSGASFALLMADLGHKVKLYEKRDDPTVTVHSESKSINLGLSKRGIETLRAVGLDEAVLKTSVTMKGRAIHGGDGAIHFQKYGKSSEEVLHSIDRNKLSEILIRKVKQHQNIHVMFNVKLLEVDTDKRVLTLEKDDGSTISESCDLLVGADGAFSAVRKSILKGNSVDYSQEFLDWGYKELTLKPSFDGSSKIIQEALHVWPRDQLLIVSHPNQDGSHTLSLFMPLEGEQGFDSIKSEGDVQSLFADYFKDLLPEIDEITKEWFEKPVGKLVNISTSAWYHEDWVVLIGDACHAQYPFYGQGMNSSLEDCKLLTSCIEGNTHDIGAALKQFKSVRKPQIDVLQSLSKANFIELKNKVNNRWFNFFKKTDYWLGYFAPQLWKPLYTMIAHTTIPYDQAIAMHKKQRVTALSVAGVALIAVAWVLI
ncbi:FAD-dependent oxidoreductase [Pseudoalteromonas piscicida]